MRLLIFGLGYVGQVVARRALAKGWNVTATVRGEAPASFARLGVTPISIGLAAAALSSSDAVLITAAPDAHGCPGFGVLGSALKAGAGPLWVGYLSTTGVYGDCQGRWVFEHSCLKARSVEGMRRVAAERSWMALTLDRIPVNLFRLPGIYGPDRSAFDRLRRGQATSVVRDGQVFSRIHVEDLAAGLEASIARPRLGGVYNLVDDEPAPAHVVTAHAARMIGLPPPATQPYDPQTMRPEALRFYAESKRVSNALAKAELGWRPRYPTYREGLTAVLAAEAANPPTA